MNNNNAKTDFETYYKELKVNDNTQNRNVLFFEETGEVISVRLLEITNLLGLIK